MIGGQWSAILVVLRFGSFVPRRAQLRRSSQYGVGDVFKLLLTILVFSCMQDLLQICVFPVDATIHCIAQRIVIVFDDAASLHTKRISVTFERLESCVFFFQM